MSYQHVTAEDISGTADATELEVNAYNAALDYLADDGDRNDEWLWGNGDFITRLRVVCGQIVEADSDSPNVDSAMRETAADFVRWFDTA